MILIMKRKSKSTITYISTTILIVSILVTFRSYRGYQFRKFQDRLSEVNKIYICVDMSGKRNGSRHGELNEELTKKLCSSLTQTELTSVLGMFKSTMIGFEFEFVDGSSCTIWGWGIRGDTLIVPGGYILDYNVGDFVNPIFKELISGDN